MMVIVVASASCGIHSDTARPADLVGSKMGPGADDVLQADEDRLLLGQRQQHQGQEVVGPVGHEAEEDHQRHRLLGQRRGDAEEGRHVGEAG